MSTDLLSSSVEGRTAIVTGAANGLGRAISRRWAHGGAKVLLVDRDPVVDERACDGGGSGALPAPRPLDQLRGRSGPPATREAFEKGMPDPEKLFDSFLIRRLAEPEEIAELVSYRSSPATTYVTGANWVIDGGYCAR